MFSTIRQVSRFFWLVLLLSYQHSFSRKVFSIENQLQNIRMFMDSCYVVPIDVYHQLQQIESLDSSNHFNKRYIAKAYFFEGIAYSIANDFGKSLVA